ncbi:MAG: ABC transporter permease [Candidatus Sumerlaeota bacterium]|nr:ABC transporter permease [Candidatus Sumerlaeota bacterium]
MRCRAHYWIIWSTWLDFARRKDFYVILILMSLFVIAALTMRQVGVENAAEARLMLSCGLGLASALSAVLTALFSARALPEEFESRTLYPLLAKPVTRAQALAGRFAGILLLCVGSLLVFVLLAWVPAPKVPGQRLVLLAQALALQGIALAALAWLALWLSVRLQTVLSAFLALAVYFLGGTLVDVVMRSAGGASPAARRVLEHALGVVPDFSAFAFLQRYVDGGAPLAWGQFGVLAAYGAAFAALFASLAVWSFGRKQL